MILNVVLQQQPDLSSQNVFPRHILSSLQRRGVRLGQAQSASVSERRTPAVLIQPQDQAGSALRSQRCDSCYPPQLAKQRDLAASGIRSSRLILQVEKKKHVIVFQVNEAVPVTFRGELSWYSANPTTENVKKLPGNIWDHRENLLRERSLLRADNTFQGIACSVGIFALSPVIDLGGRKDTAAQGSLIAT